MIAAGTVLALGSLSGLSAAVRVGSLERRLEALERARRIASTTTGSSNVPRVETGRVDVAPTTIVETVREPTAAATPIVETVREPTAAATPIVEAARGAPAAAPLAEEETLRDRWNAIEYRAVRGGPAGSAQLRSSSPLRC